MGDVEEVGAQRGEVDVAVVGEDEPGGEVRRASPRVAEDGAGGGLDVQAGMAGAGDLHDGNKTLSMAPEVTGTLGTSDGEAYWSANAALRCAGLSMTP